MLPCGLALLDCSGFSGRFPVVRSALLPPSVAARVQELGCSKNRRTGDRQATLTFVDIKCLYPNESSAFPLALALSACAGKPPVAGGTGQAVTAGVALSPCRQQGILPSAFSCEFTTLGTKSSVTDLGIFPFAPDPAVKFQKMAFLFPSNHPCIGVQVVTKCV